LWEADATEDRWQTMMFAPNGRSLALINSAGDCVALLDAATGRERVRFKEACATLEFSADGRFLALGMQDGVVKVLHVVDGKEIANFEGHRERIRSLAFGAEAATLISADAGGNLLVWDTREAVRKARQHIELDADETLKHWADLANPGRSIAYRAIGSLSASPRQILAMLKDQLQPAKGVDDARIDKLIGDLESDDEQLRTKALTELGMIGERAQPALKSVLEGDPSPQMREQVEKLIRWLSPTNPMPEALREIRAIEVLENLGTPEARSFLQELAKGTRGARLTREATAALKRLRAVGE
jgi:HEAT repeat protein